MEFPYIYMLTHTHHTHTAVYIGAIVGGAVLVGLLVVLLTVAVIVLCTTRYKMKKTQDFLGHLTLSQRLVRNYYCEAPLF